MQQIWRSKVVIQGHAGVRYLSERQAEASALMFGHCSVVFTVVTIHGVCIYD